VSTQANLWRISGDFWDTWTKLDQHFDLLYTWRDTGGIGHWPDADMIPFGHICIRSKAGGQDRLCRYTHDEQMTLMSLWCLAPSPLMLGGKLPDNTEWDLSVITNDEVLAINQDPLGKQARRIAQTGEAPNRCEVWMKQLADGSHAVGLFNRGSAAADVILDWRSAGLEGPLEVRDVWQHKDVGKFDSSLKLSVPPHGAVLLKLVAAGDDRAGAGRK
jgi:hypothetical protein